MDRIDVGVVKMSTQGLLSPSPKANTDPPSFGTEQIASRCTKSRECLLTVGFRYADSAAVLPSLLNNRG
ncbi:hypothetical protein OIU74_013146 [Salix koriyanagi]|uniref:Uncharacterized protein n=1 Tax=Salix koriyanagi TaxID=2511006 RepID=A0A9Q0Q8F8_9ROSI|nr:hypothetical protein OIU74_013146 [Salix koriyanagi]